MSPRQYYPPPIHAPLPLRSPCLPLVFFLCLLQYCCRRRACTAERTDRERGQRHVCRCCCSLLRWRVRLRWRPSRQRSIATAHSLSPAAASSSLTTSSPICFTCVRPAFLFCEPHAAMQPAPLRPDR